MSSGRLVSWACVHSGCQSPGHPIALFSVPGTLTLAGWTTLSFPPDAAAGGGLPRTADVPVADRCPALSFSTARYSTSRPLGRAETSWNTRYGALSSVPSGCHAVVPTGRQAKLTWLNPLDGTVTPTSARLSTVAPVDDRKVM